ncbi:siroheme synthase CysG [Yoonia litorea]|uniref:Uroporphyrin-III C-methyltransferase / precorrin-2 dehydrogenase / sirohydrochlorin ferrochelatase n=1 Tax=Yoonia litorea TaxID=1123755 RepID=A0A1I6LRG7_9RHOB|nr:siroheme synthase CysG [Yoonia litorea]SFS05890.1 uroporphyrin-III C-methyltransferase / precorrin-2 dehydrogenase / sirohydrochlorin ferrochelatase [Yoonia litorea]
MKAFPMFIRTSGRRVTIVGGGEQAAQKARLIGKTDAKLVLVAQDLEDELQGLVQSGRAEHVKVLSSAVFEDAAFAFVGTGCPGFDAAAHALAKAARCPVNVVDQPDLCDLTTPAIVDRDPIVVAIGSEGTAPVLTRDIKTKLEALLPQNLGGLAALAGNLRPRVTQKIARHKRRAFWAWVFKGAAGATWTRGAQREAARLIKEAIADGGAPKEREIGHIALVGAGPGARDLMTLRAVERLQEADVIFYDRLVDPEVLELARRDAERVFVGKVVGAHAWPQEKISEMIVAEARKGRSVVRLKSGDPAIFGRATEEIRAAKATGIPVEMVPGVTAASAAAAFLGRSLTERGVADTFVIATGTGCADHPRPECTRLAGPGTTTALYMSVGQASRIAADMMQQGLPSHSRVDVCVDVSKKTERHIQTTIGQLAEALHTHDVTSCAIILVTWPRDTVVGDQVHRRRSLVCA